MANGQLQGVISQLRRLIGAQSGGSLTDAQLVEAFVARQDQTAFEVLVWRHGTMVYNVCLRILQNAHAAEDGFQASFLILAKKAGSIGRSEAVGSWLFKVAYRVACRMKRSETKIESLAAEIDVAAPETPDELLWRDLRPILDEEISRLPEKYREPIVLCYLEGYTNEEAAQELGCPKGTILSRLARGRDRLRSKLTRRGLALSAGMAILSQNTASAAVPAVLVNSTVKAAIGFAAGNAAPGLISASVASLTEGVLKAMFIAKLKMISAAVAALVILGSGIGLFVHQASAQRTADNRELVAQREPPKTKDTNIRGKVIDVGREGKSFTLEIPPQGRGDDAVEAKRVEVKIGDKTAVAFINIGFNGAKITEGFTAQVRFAEGAKDVPAQVVFQGTEHVGRGRTPDITGKVVAIPGTGMISVEVPSTRPREEDPKKMNIKHTDKTLILFSRIAKDGATLKEDYVVQIWLAEPQGTTAAIIQLSGTETVRERGGPDADASGKILSVSKDGKTISLEIPPQRIGGRDEKREEKIIEGKKLDIKLSDKTTLAFDHVGLDGAKVTVGYTAHVWFEGGSKGAAAKVSLFGVVKERGTNISGKVASVGKDGTTFTVELPAVGRDRETKKIDVKITPKTRIAFSGVGFDGAAITEGYFAQVHIDEGSKDAATEIMFSKAGGIRR